MAVIEDGRTGDTAKVNAENELETRAISSSVTLHAVDEGRGFNINTGVLTLTNDVADTAILYIKNTDVNDMVTTSITISTTESTGGANDILHLKQVGNFDAASDIIVNGSNGLAVNRNSGKTSRVFNGIVKIGGTGSSFTDEFAGQQVMGDFKTARTFDLTTIIPVGGEVGVTVDVPTSNTSFGVMLSVNFHIKEDL